MIRLFKSFGVLSVFLLITQISNAQPKYGKDAFEIALPSLNGDTLKLSSLKGKVVLLDFWASWCGPCRSANKDIGKLYSKFKDKGFEVFSVSLDDNINAWEKAVKKDKITWQQVNENGGWSAKTARQWFIEALPTTFLIGKDGKLMAMDLSEKQLEQVLKDLL
ncbi:MAG: TlpA disulfide reductase family protein [Chitinophagaceae bacterium]